MKRKLKQYLLGLLLTIGAACAQDNMQNVNVNGAGVHTFDLQDYNYGRGDGLYTLWAFWFSKFGTPIGGAESEHMTANPDHPSYIGGVHTSGDPLSDPTFMAWNAAQNRPLVIGSVLVDFDAPSGGTFALDKRIDPSRGYTHILQGVFTVPSNGTYTVTVNFRQGNAIIARTMLTLIANNGQGEPPPAPNAFLSASPTVLVAGQSTIFAPSCNLSASFSYDYGDGIGGDSATHTYSSAGVYTATILAVTTNGNAAASVVIYVYGIASVPAARFDSDIVACVGRPCRFDASPSTDKENKVSEFLWDFGDATELGTGQAISHVFESIGTYTVTLTITDHQGLTHSASRDIEVISVADYESLNTEISFKARYSLSLGSVVAGRDFVDFFARVNVGEELASGWSGKNVSVSIGTKTFSGVLNKRGISNAGGVKFRVRTPRGQPRGTVEIRLVGRGQSGLGGVINNLIGSIVNDQVNASVDIAIGAKTFSNTVTGTGETSLVRGTFEATLD